MSLIDPIKVRIRHGDPIAQAGLSAALDRYSDLEIDPASQDGVLWPAHHPLEQRWPDVVVADYANGIATAINAAREPHRTGAPKVMILAAIDREWEIKNALERGVRGYLLTGCSVDDLVAAVRAVHRGERHLSPQIAARLAESFSVEPLTAREEEVLRLVVSGLCNKAISRLLGIAVGTVKSHLKSTFDKLNVESRTQAVAAVERRGLLRDQPARVHDRSRYGSATVALVSAHSVGASRAELAA